MRPSLRLTVLLFALAGTPCAAAPVFRCVLDEVASYQDRPCERDGSPFEPNVAQPDRQDVLQARATARRERRFVERIEAERDKLHRAADADRARRAAERTRQLARCAQYQRTIEYAEEDLAEDSRRRQRARRIERQLREARDRYFSECLASR